MISKGTTHDNGGRLARYLVTGKDGERCELFDLRGFAAPDIVDAFRSVHVIAEATHCQQPFFHVQVRCPKGEALTSEQWDYTANRIERMLGLKDQPRAIAFHVEEKTGERHMHVAWSRIDEETLTAKKLPFWKERLKKVSRELELHFGLTLVPNERDSSIKYAPTRAEEEQARRLGLDVHQIRQTIRDCFERADCGRSFEAALAEEKMVLARGERRDFVVIDQAGGLHALGKRILDVSAAEARARLADIPREQLPTVEEARDLLREQTAERQREETAPHWDRHRHEIAWQKAVVDGAIQKEASQEAHQPDRSERRAEVDRETAQAFGEAHGGRQEEAARSSDPIGTGPDVVEDEKVRRKRASVIGDRWIAGPQTGHMVEHHDWAMEQVKAAEERREEARSGTSSTPEKYGAKEEQDIDLARFRSDPDYRRSVEARVAASTDQERQRLREEDRGVTRDFGQR